MNIVDDIINPALAWLPGKMDTPRARVQLLAQGYQESHFQYRRQLGNGPARGLWQMEKGGGVTGTLMHPASRELALKACQWRHVTPTPDGAWNAMETDDIFACVFARLLIWTDPQPLPLLGDAQGAWALYQRVWRPGKPRPAEWPGNYDKAMQTVAA